MYEPQVAAEHDKSSRAERRRTFCIRRRNGKAKNYGLNPKPVTAAPVPPLPPSMKFGVQKYPDIGQEVAPVYAGHLVDPADLDLEPSEGSSFDEEPSLFDGAILMAPDDELLEFFEGLPPGFHFNGRNEAETGGPFARRAERLRLQKAAEVDPDFDDPEWAYGGCEPLHLPLNNQAAA